MPLEIRKHDRTPEGAPAPLVKLLEAHYERVMDVRLDYARDDRTYVPTEMSVGVQKLAELATIEGAKLDDDAHDETPEEIGLAVLELATEHAQATGAVKYRAVLMGMKHERYQKLDSCVFTLGLDYATGHATVSEVGPGRDETLQLAHDIAKDSHKNLMSTLDKLPPVLGRVVDLVGKVAEFTGPMAQAQVELRRIELEQEEAQFESEDRRHMWTVSRDVLLKLMSVFGVQIADAWRAAGMPGAPPATTRETVQQVGDLTAQWDEMFKKLGPKKLQELSEIMGEDLAKLAEKMRTADDDQTFRNMASELTERAQKEPEWPKRLAQIMQTLGQDLGNQFATILAEAAR